MSGKPRPSDGALALEPGQFVISLPEQRTPNFKKSEVDDTTFARSAFVCINDRDSVYSNNQVELLDPIEQGLGLVGTGYARWARWWPERARWRRSPGDIVYYKNSTGMGGTDGRGEGRLIYRKAVEGSAVGQEIPTEWFGSDLFTVVRQGLLPVGVGIRG